MDSTVELTKWFENPDIIRNVSSSLLLFIVITIIRLITVRSITRSGSIPNEHRRQWIVNVKTIALLILFFGILIIWASELQAFAVSLVAVAAAIVLATKELIMNFSGYFARASAKPFSVGDRIEVEGVRGDVIDQNFFFTKLLEIGPNQITNQYTGRSVNIPNSVFLTKTIINESFTKTYTLHVFRVPLKISPYIPEMQSELLRICNEVCQTFVSDAKRAFDSFGRAQSLETPSVEPRVHIHYLDKETVDLVARIPAPTSRKGRIEQEIMGRFTMIYMSSLSGASVTTEK